MWEGRMWKLSLGQPGEVAVVVSGTGISGGLAGRLAVCVTVAASVLLLTAPDALGAAGDFSAAGTSPEAVGDFPNSVAVGDFNRDGKPDLATANEDSNNVTILLGRADGNFDPAPTSPETAGDGPVSVAVGDFNGDGKQDLATANAFTNNEKSLAGQGGGHLN